jgi:hypothetical protein
MVLPLIGHAGAGRHPGDGMDTGFRRYDGNFMPIRRLDLTAHVFPKENTKVEK